MSPFVESLPKIPLKRMLHFFWKCNILLILLMKRVSPAYLFLLFISEFSSLRSAGYSQKTHPQGSLVHGWTPKCQAGSVLPYSPPFWAFPDLFSQGSSASSPALMQIPVYSGLRVIDFPNTANTLYSNLDLPSPAMNCSPLNTLPFFVTLCLTLICSLYSGHP